MGEMHLAVEVFSFEKGTASDQQAAGFNILHISLTAMEGQ